ncbi:unnamed protein product [Amoebophrya sp. A25]|nr:unnamed protein product [Amoebophrya sp. A25]|eukprot:GSA25T00015897001.1
MAAPETSVMTSCCHDNNSSSHHNSKQITMSVVDHLQFQQVTPGSSRSVVDHTTRHSSSTDTSEDDTDARHRADGYLYLHMSEWIDHVLLRDMTLRWRPRARKTWWYASSSFTYTTIGLVVYYRCAALQAACGEAYAPVWPWEAFALMLQGVLSYASDVHCFGLVWWVARLDQLSASTLFCMQVRKAWTVPQDAVQMGILACALLLAAVCFVCGQICHRAMVRLLEESYSCREDGDAEAPNVTSETEVVSESEESRGLVNPFVSQHEGSSIKPDPSRDKKSMHNYMLMNPHTVLSSTTSTTSTFAVVEEPPSSCMIQQQQLQPAYLDGMRKLEPVGQLSMSGAASASMDDNVQKMRRGFSFDTEEYTAGGPCGAPTLGGFVGKDAHTPHSMDGAAERVEPDCTNGMRGEEHPAFSLRLLAFGIGVLLGRVAKEDMLFLNANDRERSSTSRGKKGEHLVHMKNVVTKENTSGTTTSIASTRTISRSPTTSSSSSIQDWSRALASKYLVRPVVCRGAGSPAQHAATDGALQKSVSMPGAFDDSRQAHSDTTRPRVEDLFHGFLVYHTAWHYVLPVGAYLWVSYTLQLPLLPLIFNAGTTP